MSVRFDNAPVVTERLRTESVPSAETSPDRDSQAEAYMAPSRQLGTDSLNLHARAQNTRILEPTAAPAAATRRSWLFDPVVSGILAVALALSLVYAVGGLELAIILAITLLVGLLLYGLGFDLRKRPAQALMLPRQLARPAGTGPLG